MSKARLADAIGASRQSVSRWERGRAKPSARYLARMERVFNGETLSEVERSISVYIGAPVIWAGGSRIGSVHGVNDQGELIVRYP
jgi:transcriptional regulator with XRE-family HTH domain